MKILLELNEEGKTSRKTLELPLIQAYMDLLAGTMGFQHGPDIVLHDNASVEITFPITAATSHHIETIREIITNTVEEWGDMDLSIEV